MSLNRTNIELIVLGLLLVAALAGFFIWLAVRAAEPEPPPAGKPSLERGHEVSDAPTWYPVAFAFFLTILAGLVVVIAAGLFRSFRTAEHNQYADAYSQLRTPTPLTTEPLLQSDETFDMNRLRAREDALLASYGWADQANGEVRIPIAQAMQIIAQQGLPATPKDAAAQYNVDPNAVSLLPVPARGGGAPGPLPPAAPVLTPQTFIPAAKPAGKPAAKPAAAPAGVSHSS